MFYSYIKENVGQNFIQQNQYNSQLAPVMGQDDEIDISTKKTNWDHGLIKVYGKCDVRNGNQFGRGSVQISWDTNSVSTGT
ncbi:hypothetical protein QTP88_014967 [Uroleucon formosanum]